jgi:hypothetical protein
MRAALIALAVLTTAAAAEAQSSLAVDIDRAHFVWEWTQGSGGPAREFRIRCGTATHIISDPALRTVAVKTVVANPGSYSCTIAAANEFGEAPPSPAVQFQTGQAPAPVTGVRIEVR